MEQKKVKELLKSIPCIHALGIGVKNRLRDAQAIPAFLAERRIRREGPIRVGFLCQFIPAWTKVASIYERMRQDQRFQPYLICVPSGIQNGRLVNPDSPENDTYDYFVQHGYSEAINALVGREQWLDLGELKLSYLFYPRPYTPLLPDCYNPRRVSHYTRVCILMYGYTNTQEVTRTTLNRDFMGSVYCYFAETPFAQRINIRNNWLPHKLKLQKTVFLGVPVLEQLSRCRNEVSPSWDFSKNDFRVLWTPRWTTDKAEGGSNFFTYYLRLLDYARHHPDVDLLFRPHPLAFSNFIKTGEMTREQVAEYQKCCWQLPNVSLDRQSQYEATLWGSSVLVSDISSMMPEYFTTGKPLIYCASNMELELADFARRMIEGCYVVYNERELFACLEKLKSGDDPLREKRKALINELFGSAIEGATDRILEELAADA